MNGVERTQFFVFNIMQMSVVTKSLIIFFNMFNTLSLGKYTDIPFSVSDSVIFEPRVGMSNTKIKPSWVPVINIYIGNQGKILVK